MLGERCYMGMTNINWQTAGVQKSVLCVKPGKWAKA